MPNPTLLTAAWIAPMAGPTLRDAGVVFDSGRVLALGPIPQLRRDYPQATLHDAGNAVVLPGLINAHTHLELSHLTPGPQPARFVDWIIQLMQRADPTKASDAMAIGIQQCQHFGITCVGDITAQPAITRPILVNSPLMKISYGEVRGMARRRSLTEQRITAAIDHTAFPRSPGCTSGATSQSAHFDGQYLQAGISPHAPYSIERSGYESCLAAARASSLPLTTHLAETREEAEFLADHTGPFRELWDLLGAWDSDVPRFTGGPVRFAKAAGLLDYPTLLAHMNYCDDDELNLLANSPASVVYCPRTHAYFGHPPHRWRDMLARGINVAIGTDSCASSPDLNLVDDLRLLHRIAPDMEAEQLWRLATINAAKAIRSPGHGTLTPGSFANAVVFAVGSNEPLVEILDSTVLPSELWIAGRKI
jgi:aminodeoxyfutalosine deaminase